MMEIYVKFCRNCESLRSFNIPPFITSLDSFEKSRRGPDDARTLSSNVSSGEGVGRKQSNPLLCIIILCVSIYFSLGIES